MHHRQVRTILAQPVAGRRLHEVPLKSQTAMPRRQTSFRSRQQQKDDKRQATVAAMTKTETRSCATIGLGQDNARCL